VTKSKHERAIDAEQRATDWHFKAITAEGDGDAAKAERMREKAQFWRDRMNLLIGNGNGIRDLNAARSSQEG
jgi:hypothetical protein